MKTRINAAVLIGFVVAIMGCQQPDNNEAYAPSLLFSPDVFDVGPALVKPLDKAALETFLESAVRSPRGGCKFFDYIADHSCSETVKEVVVKDPHHIVLRGVATSGADATTGPVKAWTKVEYVEFTCANAAFDQLENKEMEGAQNLFKFCPDGVGGMLYLLKTDLSYGEGQPKKFTYTGIGASTGAPCDFTKVRERLDLSPGCLFQELSRDEESEKVLVWKEASTSYHEALSDAESFGRGKTTIHLNGWQGEVNYHDSDVISFQMSKNGESVLKEIVPAF